MAEKKTSQLSSRTLAQINKDFFAISLNDTEDENFKVAYEVIKDFIFDVTNQTANRIPYIDSDGYIASDRTITINSDGLGIGSDAPSSAGGDFALYLRSGIADSEVRIAWANDVKGFAWIIDGGANDSCKLRNISTGSNIMEIDQSNNVGFGIAEDKLSGTANFKVGNASTSGVRFVTSDWNFGSTGTALSFYMGANTGNTYAIIAPTDAGGGSVTDLTIQPSTSQVARVSIGDTSFSAKVRIQQGNSAGAIPVLELEQKDVSEEFLKLIGTASSGVLTQSIVNNSDVTTPTLQGWLKCYVQDDGNQITDQAYFIPIYTLA